MFVKAASLKRVRFVVAGITRGAALAAAFVVPAHATTQAGPFQVYDSADAYAIEGYTTANNGIGVEGYAALASATGVTGVLGYTSSQFSTGVTGYSDGTGTSYGVYGYSANGNGLYGKSISSSAASIYGLNGNSGTAIFGYSNGLGVYGISTGTNGIVGSTQTSDGTGNHYAGVLGVDKSTAGKHSGVAGTTPNDGGYAVYGFSSGPANNQGKGVVGVSNGLGAGVAGSSSGGGNGVVGQALGTGSGNGIDGYSGGTGYGVMATIGQYANAAVRGTSSSNTNSIGVNGQSTIGTGVMGQATGLGGEGVYGEASNSSGYGVFGNATGASSTGVFAYMDNPQGVALRLQASPGTVVRVIAANGASDIMSLNTGGNLILKGSLVQGGTPLAVLRNPNGAGRVVYSSQQAEPTIEDVGEAHLVAGRTYVRLDPAFAELIDRDAPYYVFVTPEDPIADQPYVTEKSSHGFVVRAMSNRANVAFQYRIVARPASARRLSRLAAFHDPAPFIRRDPGASRIRVAEPYAASPSQRETRSHGITLGRLPQPLQAPFVPKPRPRR